MNFSAVILAGGKSSRMGCDKAFLEIGGEVLLARQIRLAWEIGAKEIFISARKDTDYSTFDCRVLLDKFSNAGPLAGIERALDAVKSPMLLALAVDLPEMNADFLRKLAKDCSETCGAVPQLANHVEPLAAFYPKAAHQLAATSLERRDLAMKNFAALCVQSRLARLIQVDTDEMLYFTNWNSPRLTS